MLSAFAATGRALHPLRGDDPDQTQALLQQPSSGATVLSGFAATGRALHPLRGHDPDQTEAVP